MVKAALFLTSFLFVLGHADAQSLDYSASPDPVTLDTDLSPTDLSPLEFEPQTIEQIFENEGINVLTEFPVVIIISKALQTATVYENGVVANSFLISTGREQWETAKSGRHYFTTTPVGWFSPVRYSRQHWSATWDAWMEYAIFFNGGVALHATTPDHFKELGRRASGGCVRMHPDNALWFWNLSLSDQTAYVPYFTRNGQLMRDSSGNVKRHMASGTLIIVSAN